MQIAAARSLAEAEHYRALDPLLSLLGDPSEDVRAEAARTLGRVRERKAITCFTCILR